ncbi:hypothetical protein LshimejAT787_1302690 [Lyophyllum shimeji]|uniref:Uncharacterized protein n=1 Tax=Lyophyllum shimeji TaxID=47721 RepID=A0A9P3PXF7_LYOSH|nr:hypothetical protein LshimejAT787_1302690 [Lyophyllum shimeji]
MASSPTLKHREWTNISRPHVPELATNVNAGTKESSSSLVSPIMSPKRTGPFYSFSPKTTSISFPWPKEVTGIERIALSSKGDLQRVLSAFFARPITIALVYSNTFQHRSPETPTLVSLPNPSAIASASPTSPIVQTRQVHLQCSGKIVCTATSTVRITSPTYAHLFLEEKYAIGQLFARIGKVPEFDLVSVGLGPVTDAPLSEKQSLKPDAEQLWRKYKLFVPDFECEILEEFPSRDMFVGGQQWLDDAKDSEWSTESFVTSVKEMQFPSKVLRCQTSLILLLGLSFLLMLAYELSMLFTGRSLLCYV